MRSLRAEIQQRPVGVGRARGEQRVVASLSRELAQPRYRRPQIVQWFVVGHLVPGMLLGSLWLGGQGDLPVLGQAGRVLVTPTRPCCPGPPGATKLSPHRVLRYES